MLSTMTVIVPGWIDGLQGPHPCSHLRSSRRRWPIGSTTPSTATIEEVDPEPKGAAVHPSRVPDSTPAPVFTAPAETAQNITPSSTPAALKPVKPGSASEKPSDV